MKKTLPIIISLIVLITIVILISKFFHIANQPAYVSVISGTEVSNYQGSPYYTDDNGPTIPIDLKKISGLTPAEANSTQKNFYATADSSYALFWGMPYGVGAGIRIINVEKQTASSFPYPETPAYVVDYIWMGNNLLLHYYSADGLVAGGGLNRDTARTDHYYLLDPTTGKFTPISVDSATSQYTAHGYNVYFSKESDANKKFAVNYCEKKDSMGVGCLMYGFSLSNGVSIKHIFDASGEFTWGWANGDFFVSEGTKVFLVDFSKLIW